MLPDSAPPPSRPLQPKTTRGQQRTAEYPSIKRRRPTVIACHHCRLKKIRCDGQRPACSSCSAKAVPCTYRDAPHACKAVREAVPGVVHMLGRLCATELVRVVARLKDESDAETILSTIKGCLARQDGSRHHDASAGPPSTAGSGGRTPRTPDALAQTLGADVDWYWPADCQTTPATEFAVQADVSDQIVDYWPNQWPRAWARFPNDI